MSKDLPELSVELVVLAAILRAEERKSPGFTDAVQRELENEAIRGEVVRLRGPRLAPEVLENFRLGANWVNAVRRTTAAAASPVPKLRWWSRPPR